MTLAAIKNAMGVRDVPLEECLELQIPFGSVEVVDIEMARFNTREDAEEAIADKDAIWEQVPYYIRNRHGMAFTNPEWTKARWSVRAFTHPEKKQTWFAVADLNPPEIISP